MNFKKFLSVTILLCVIFSAGLFIPTGNSYLTLVAIMPVQAFVWIYDYKIGKPLRGGTRDSVYTTDQFGLTVLVGFVLPMLIMGALALFT